MTVTAKLLVSDFSSSTSLHGLSHAMDTDLRFNRFRWKNGTFLFVLVVSLVFAIWNLTAIMVDYYDYPVTSEVKVVYQYESEFPAVTFCNLNQWAMQSGKSASNELADMLHFCAYEHPTESSCLYDQSEYFYAFIDHGTGDRCFTFNPNHYQNGSARPKMITQKKGVQEGLRMVLDVYQDMYQIQDDMAAGLKVVVHVNDQHPFPSSQAIVVTPGQSTRLKVRKTRIKNTPKPYSDCEVIGEVENEAKNYFAADYSYNQDDCVTTCKLVEKIRSCSCCQQNSLSCDPLRSRRLFGLDIPADLAACEPGDLCPLTFESSYDPQSCQGACSPPCEQLDYEVTPSSLMFPYLKYMDRGPTEFLGRHKLKSDPDTSYRTNVLQLLVFFESLNEEVIETSAKYDWSVLLANIGGQLGLCMGFSLLTALELVVLVLDLVCHVTRGVKVPGNAGS